MDSSFTEEKKQTNLPLVGGDMENESEKDTGAVFSYQQTHFRNSQKWPKENTSSLKNCCCHMLITRWEGFSSPSQAATRRVATRDPGCQHPVTGAAIWEQLGKSKMHQKRACQYQLPGNSTQLPLMPMEGVGAQHLVRPDPV